MPKCSHCGCEFSKQGLANHENVCGEGWKDKALLERLYCKEDMKMCEIADEYDANVKTVYSWLDKFGIETEKTHHHTEPWKQEKRLKKEYHENGLGFKKIAEKFGTSKSNIQYWMQKHGIERRGRLDYLTETPPKISTSKEGYEYFTTPDGQVKHHKLLAISSGESPYDVFDSSNHIHHKNNIPWDNRQGNIELLSHSEHMKLTQAARRGDVEYAQQ